MANYGLLLRISDFLVTFCIQTLAMLKAPALCCTWLQSNFWANLLTSAPMFMPLDRCCTSYLLRLGLFMGRGKKLRRKRLLKQQRHLAVMYPQFRTLGK